MTEGSSPRAGDTLRVAARLFLKQGYASVSINALIKEVGGSKRDFYAEFENKEGLFRRVVISMCEDVLAPLRALSIEKGPAEETLRAFGEMFVTFLLTPEVLALQRLVISESAGNPEFARIFYKQGPQSAHRVAAAMLSDLKKRGEIELESPEISAILFCDMLASEFQFRKAAGSEVSSKDIKERVRAGVRIFLHGALTTRHLD